MNKLQDDVKWPDTDSAQKIQIELPHVFITGQAGHGKDTIGDHLIACYGYKKLSFSDGIRDEISLVYGKSQKEVSSEWQSRRDLKDCEQPQLALKNCSDLAFINIALKAFEKEDESIGCDKDLVCERMLISRSPRRIQQIWGTEYRRTQDESYWLKYAEKNADFSRPQVLTSVRYPNELELGERIGAVRVHVERLDIVNAADHVTERTLPLKSGTIVIKNDGDIDSLYKQVDAMVAKLFVVGSENLKNRQRACP